MRFISLIGGSDTDNNEKHNEVEFSKISKNETLKVKKLIKFHIVKTQLQKYTQKRIDYFVNKNVYINFIKNLVFCFEIQPLPIERTLILTTIFICKRQWSL